jgi:hypothetical protein
MIRSVFGRRAALRTLAGGAAGLAASGSWVESLCALARQHAHEQASAAITAQTWTPRVLTPAQNDLVITLTERIIPETTTPGAKATLVNRFIDSVLSDAPAKERARFTGGLAWLDSRSQVLFGKDFLRSTAAEQTTLLTRLSEGADRGTADAADRPGIDFFRAIKSMTITGYYTTEVGLMKELGDDGVLAMAEFKGCDHPEHE